jgi:hypothetical protein
MKMNKIEKRPEGVATKLLNIIACLTFFVFSVFPFSLSFAAEEVSTVTISVNEQGKTIIIADGKTLEVAAGDGWRIFTFSSGETIGVFIDSRTDAPSIKIYSGTVHVLAGDTTTTVPEGAAMSVNVNHETGAASVTAIAGTIQVEAGTTTTTVPEGSTMAASVDIETGAATVIAVTGTVEVTSEGKTVLVQQGGGQPQLFRENRLRLLSLCLLRLRLLRLRLLRLLRHRLGPIYRLRQIRQVLHPIRLTVLFRDKWLGCR